MAGGCGGGMGRMEASIAIAALGDGDGRVRAAGVRLCEPFLVPATRADVLPEMLKLVEDADFDVRLQLVLTLSAVPEKGADTAVVKILERDGKNVLVREAAISGLRGRELEFLEKVVAGKAAEKNLVSALAQCVMNERRGGGGKKLLEVAGGQGEGLGGGVLEGMAGAQGGGGAGVGAATFGFRVGAGPAGAIAADFDAWREWVDRCDGGEFSAGDAGVAGFE